MRVADGDSLVASTLRVVPLSLPGLRRPPVDSLGDLAESGKANMTLCRTLDNPRRMDTFDEPYNGPLSCLDLAGRSDVGNLRHERQMHN